MWPFVIASLAGYVVMGPIGVPTACAALVVLIAILY